MTAKPDESLKSIFSAQFNNADWTNFLHDFFGVNSLYAKPRALGKRDDAEGFLLGEFTDANGYAIGLYRFDIASGSVLRRKTGLRHLVERHLKTEYDAAIAVFTEKDSPHWRFSYICDIKGANTHPKRFTYVFGDPNQQYRTPVERFQRLKSSGITHKNILEAFAVEPLSKQFYNELFAWYLDAVKQVKFPADIIPDDSRRNAEMTIRLISRLLFCWFLKQKNIIPSKFFDKAQADRWLNYSDATGSTYYKAILQNLFFATLNLDPKESKRAFVKNQIGKKGVEGYRYYRFFKPGMADEFQALCAGIPFLNGGLFECLDRDRETSAPRRLDCFSNLTANEPHLAVPDALFFDPGNGLLPLLSRYNFTVEENSVSDAVVALDPELLGRVFENLLGAYNPETRETARKQTGSFYTPREIVDYMADAALEAWSASLAPEQRVEAIPSVKILDPACGSGAFPMGILFRLMERWEKANPELAATPEERYKAKLAIIEQCIYGVDIQPIAVQIAKLRCFISLVCDWSAAPPPHCQISKTILSAQTRLSA